VDAIAKLYLDDRKGSAPKSYEWLNSQWENHLKPFFGGITASRVTTEKMIEYRNERIDQKASPTTINKELGMLRAAYYHAMDDYTPAKINRVPKFPVKLPEPPPRKGFINDQQYNALQDNCKDSWLRAVLAIAYTYGFRRSEIVGRPQRNHPPMKVNQVDMEGRTIRLNPGETKNKEGRVVKMTQEVYDLLKPCIEGKSPDDAVFMWNNGKPVKDFRETWRQLIEASEGIPSNLLLHDFRRSAARNLLGAGVNQDVAMRITGHKTASMFSRYNIVAESDLAEAAEKLELKRSATKAKAEQQTQTAEIGRKLDATQSSLK
jgi:integrase